MLCATVARLQLLEFALALRWFSTTVEEIVEKIRFSPKNRLFLVSAVFYPDYGYCLRGTV